ncbi:MAG TPA: prohibitin family protein [Ohtaekwangia sp.]|uniref:prohibitin family protein n=1 Tax=Ohtaekwangia sp. TaxID=2066019 RepID=UPI002F934534
MKNVNFLKASAFIALAFLMTQCAIVRPGEVGIVQRMGVIRGASITQGSRWFNPFTSKVVKINARTVESFNTLPLPTKEGLSVNTEISLLYHVNPESAKAVYTRFGRNYEEVIVLSNFRATAREVSSRYFAKELYATERTKIEKAVAEELSSHIAQYGFVVDAVLLKDIDLPAQLAQAIENKVNAEQAVLQMEFVVEKQKKEAERLVIEAEGIKKAQDIINQSLTEKLLQYNNIQMLKSLVNSPNTKVIVTGSQPSQLMVNTDKNP